MQSTLVLYFMLGFITVSSVYARSVEDVSFEPGEEECIRELDLDRHQIAKMHLEDITADDNSKYNSFKSCFWKKMGWQLPNGEIDYDALESSLKELISEEMENETPEVQKETLKIVSKGIRKCEMDPPPTGSSHGQTAVRVQNCVFSEIYDKSLEDESFEKEEEECISELDLDRDQIAKLHFQELTADDNSKYNSFMSCVWKKMGWQLENGEIDYNALENSLKELVVEEVENESSKIRKEAVKIVSKGVRKCEGNPPAIGSSHGQTVIRVQNCVMNEYTRLIMKMKIYED